MAWHERIGGRMDIASGDMKIPGGGMAGRVWMGAEHTTTAQHFNGTADLQTRSMSSMRLGQTRYGWRGNMAYKRRTTVVTIVIKSPIFD